MIIHIENPKNSTKKLLELINKLSKDSGYKINMQNQLHFYALTTKSLIKKKETTQTKE